MIRLRFAILLTCFHACVLSVDTETAGMVRDEGVHSDLGNARTSQYARNGPLVVEEWDEDELSDERYLARLNRLQLMNRIKAAKKSKKSSMVQKVKSKMRAKKKKKQYQEKTTGTTQTAETKGTEKSKVKQGDKQTAATTGKTKTTGKSGGGIEIEIIKDYVLEESLSIPGEFSVPKPDGKTTKSTKSTKTTKKTTTTTKSTKSTKKSGGKGTKPRSSKKGALLTGLQARMAPMEMNETVVPEPYIDPFFVNGRRLDKDDEEEEFDDEEEVDLEEEYINRQRYRALWSDDRQGALRGRASSTQRRKTPSEKARERVLQAPR